MPPALETGKEPDKISPLVIYVAWMEHNLSSYMFGRRSSEFLQSRIQLPCRIQKVTPRLTHGRPFRLDDWQSPRSECRFCVAVES
jgi:hypothetical protein